MHSTWIDRFWVLPTELYCSWALGFGCLLASIGLMHRLAGSARPGLASLQKCYTALGMVFVLGALYGLSFRLEWKLPSYASGMPALSTPAGTASLLAPAIAAVRTIRRVFLGVFNGQFPSVVEHLRRTITCSRSQKEKNAKTDESRGSVGTLVADLLRSGARWEVPVWWMSGDRLRYRQEFHPQRRLGAQAARFAVVARVAWAVERAGEAGPAEESGKR